MSEPRMIKPEAWLFHCRKPGKTITFASVDENDTLHWPLDQWTAVTVTPLYSRAALLADRPDVAERVKHLRSRAGDARRLGQDSSAEDDLASAHLLESLAAQLADHVARKAELAHVKVSRDFLEIREAELAKEVKRLREIMRELLDSEATPCPPFESGKEAQDAWADRRAKARNDAEAATKEPTR